MSQNVYQSEGCNKGVKRGSTHILGYQDSSIRIRTCILPGFNSFKTPGLSRGVGYPNNMHDVLCAINKPLVIYLA